MLLFSSARSATGALRTMRLLVTYYQPSGMGCSGGSIETAEEERGAACSVADVLQTCSAYREE